jgi:hypothetical protein
MKYTDLRHKYDVLVNEKSGLIEVLTLIEQYIMPFRAYFNGPIDSSNQITWRRKEIYDSTAIFAAQTLAANLHSNLTNPVLLWFSLVTRDKKLNQVNEVKRWLEECTQRVYQAFGASNFELQINETYLDIVGFGTAILLQEARELQDGALENIDFSTIPIEEAVFETDYLGRTSSFFRLLKWTPAQIISKFGESEVPQKVRDAANNPEKSMMRMSILFSIYRRKEIDQQWADGHAVLPPLSRPWACEYHLFEDGTLLYEGGYYEMPVYVAKWRRTSGSDWGFSQAMICLSDVLTINKLVELTLKAGEKAIDPPALVTRRGVFGDINLKAGGHTVVDKTDNITYLRNEGRFDVSSLSKEDLQRSIEKSFFVDQLQLKDSPAMTATEAQIRYQLMQRLLGPSLGCMKNGLYDPLVEGTFRILYRYGLLPPAPEVIRQSGVQFAVEYSGPMARAQRFDVVASIERWMLDVSQLAAAFPTAIDVPDIDEVVKELGYSAGVPARLVQSDSVIMLNRIKKQKRQDMANKIQMATGAGQAVKAIGEGTRAMNGR